MELGTNKIIISNEVLSQEVNGETVILDLNSESYFGLDEIGTRIWQLLQVNGDIQKTFDIMMDEFEVDSETLESDMGNLINDMIEKGLVSIP